VRAVDAEDEVARKYGLLKYRTISFASLVEELGKRYDAYIIIQDDKLKEPLIKVSDAFEESLSLNDILQVVARSFIKWSKKGRIYNINPVVHL
jgi:hypothetical protein